MKQVTIGSLVGGLLIFLWQFASWTFLDLHRPQQAYTPHQDTILQFLSEHLATDGGFFLPTTPKSAGAAEQQQLMAQSINKPWAQVFYHTRMEDNMLRNMIRGLVTNILLVFLFMWVAGKFTRRDFGTIFGAALAVGLLVFLNEPYTQHIWFQSFDLWASFADAMISWALAGAWLGWWMKK